jgi:hypothetical protein
MNQLIPEATFSEYTVDIPSEGKHMMNDKMASANVPNERTDIPGTK